MPGSNFTYGRYTTAGALAKAIDDAITSGVLGGTPSDNSVTSAKIVNGSIVNADINASAAIAHSKLAAMTSGYILVGNGSTVPTAVAVSGDITMGNDGTVAIASGVIVNADINASAAIAHSKLAAMTSGYILVGNGSTVPTAVAVSGDVALSNAGVATVTDLTISSEAQGDILYRNASNWVRLAAGTAGQALVTAGAGSNPYWGIPSTTIASKLTSSFEMESGTYDIAHSVTTQTSSAPTLTIPDFAGVNDTYAFVTLAQTLVNKTLSSPTLTTPKIVTTGSINDAGGDEYLKFIESTTPVNYIQITNADSGSPPRLQGAGETNTDLLLLGSGTGNVYIADAADVTKDVNFELNGATTAKTTTLAFVQTNDRTITFPDDSVTLASVTGTETLTNKTLTLPKIATAGAICDAGGDEYLKFVESSTPVNYIQITSADTATAPRVQAAGETNVDLLLMGSGTGDVYVGDAADPTKDVQFSLVGATTAKTTTLTFVQTDDRAITFPDFDGTLATVAGIETLTNKTLTTPKIATTGAICDAGGDEYIVFVEDATPVTYLQVTSAGTGAAPKLSAAGETNVDLLLTGNGTGNVYIADATDNTKDLNFELNGATTAKTMTIISSQTDDRSLTLPDATDTLVGKATTDTFTNKSFDCDGSGNVLTNVNANELDPFTLGGTAAYGIPFVIAVEVNDEVAPVDIYDGNAPFNFEIIDAWSVNKSADGGTWKLSDAAGGSGNSITDVVTTAASDTDIDRITTLDDDYTTVAANGDLCIETDGAVDAVIYISCLRTNA
jgi:hypothetical protein